MSQVANVNPLAGNDANSVENAAMEFDKIFGDTEPTEANREPKNDERTNRSRPSEPTNDGDAPDTDPDGDSQSPNDMGDDILDDLDGSHEPEDDENDNPDADEEDGEDEDDDGEGDEFVDDAELDRKVTTTVNGEEVTLTLREALSGYSKEADYRLKTTRLAEEKAEVTEFAQAVVAERRHYQENLDRFIKMAGALQPSDEEWEAMKKADANAYIAAREQWEAIQKNASEAQAELERIAQRETEDAQRQYRDWVKSENQKLREKIPALANEKKAKEFRDRIFAYGKAMGYSENEIATGAVDHRDVITLYKAARYDEIMRSRKSGQRPGKKGPKQSNSSTARNVGKNRSNTRNRRDAERRLASSHSVDDAAMAFTEMLRS